jgi:hemerythrin
MSKDRLVIEIDPELKKQFVSTVKKEGRTMRWYLLNWIKNHIDKKDG